MYAKSVCTTTGGLKLRNLNVRTLCMTIKLNPFCLVSDMDFDCHIFSKYIAFQMKNLVFQSKYVSFRKL